MKQILILTFCQLLFIRGVSQEIICFNDWIYQVYFDSIYENDGYIKLKPLKIVDNKIISIDKQTSIVASSLLKNNQNNPTRNSVGLPQFIIDGSKASLRLKYYGLRTIPINYNGILLNTFIDGMDAFVSDLLSGIPIDSAYIDANLPYESNTKFNFTQNTCIKNSIVDLIFWDDITFQNELLFYNCSIKNLEAWNVNFNHSIKFKGCNILGQISFENCIVEGDFEYRNYSSQDKLYNSIYGGQRKRNFEDFTNAFMFERCIFNRKFTISTYYNTLIKEDLCSHKDSTTYDCNYLNWIYLNECKFDGPTTFYATIPLDSLTYVGFPYSEFRENLTIGIDYAQFISKSLNNTDIGDGFSTSVFSDNIVINTNYETDFKKLKLNTKHLSRVWLNPLYISFMGERKNKYMYITPKTEYYIVENKNNYIDFIESLKIKIEDEDTLRYASKEASSKLDYLTDKYRMHYYKHNILQSNNLVLYFKYLIVYSTTNFGYHGENKFIISSLTVIFLFSLIYFMFFQKEIIEYIKKDSNFFAINYTRPKYNLIYYALCLRFAFKLFVTIKFSYDYFNDTKGLGYIFILNWLLGIVFIILFLIYIASQYPFIKDIIGMG